MLSPLSGVGLSRRRSSNLNCAPAMPTIAFKSRVRATSDCCALTLVVKHRVIVGGPSDIVHDMKVSLPECIDVLLDSYFSITVSGKLNGGRIAPETLMDSRIAHHLAEYLRMVYFRA